MTQELRDADFRWLLQQPQGRRFLLDVIDARCGLLRSAHRGEATHDTAFVEGRKDVGRELWLEAQRVDVRAWARMVEEMAQSAVNEQPLQQKGE